MKNVNMNMVGAYETEIKELKEAVAKKNGKEKEQKGEIDRLRM